MQSTTDYEVSLDYFSRNLTKKNQGCFLLTPLEIKSPAAELNDGVLTGRIHKANTTDLFALSIRINYRCQVLKRI